MVANNWFLQFLADILEVTVERPVNVESTALGATYLAGMCAGVFDSARSVAELWRSERVFEPAMDAKQRELLLRGWRDAVRRVGDHA
jgi:glycerol kinase